MEKVPCDISDNTDEVSFASMAQQGNDQLRNCPTQPRLSTDPNFEFCRSSPTSPSPAELLFSDGHLLPHSYPTNNPTKTSKSSSTSSLSSPSLSSNTVSRSSSISSNSSSKSSGGGSARRRLRKSRERVSFPLPGPSLVATKSGSGNYRAVVGRAEARPKKEAGKQQRGLFWCIVSACRECHALEPSKVVETSSNKSIAS